MFLVNYKKLSILLICFTVVFAEETTTAKTTIKTPKTPNNKQNGGNANQGPTVQAPTNSNATITTTTKKADETTTAAATTTPDKSCGDNNSKCLEVNHNDPLCTWNDEVKTSGVCPCPVEGKDPCNVIHRTIRNIPALQAWSASVFLLSICIAGKINRVIRYYLYHCYFQKSPYVTHR